MASQSTTSVSPVQGPSSTSLSPSAPPTSAPPAQVPSSATPSTSAAASTSQQTQASSRQTSASTLLSSASQVVPTPISTSQSLPSTATLPSSQPSPSSVDNNVSNTSGPDAGQPMKIIIPVASAVGGLFAILLVSYFYRQYQRRRQLKEAPLPAKRTPAILERRHAQSVYRFKTPDNAEYDSLMAPITSSPYHLSTASYLPFPSTSTNTFDGAYTHPSPTPSASLTRLASASVVSLERQPSTVSSPTPPYDLVKDTSANILPALTSNYPPNSPPQFLQQPFTPPHVRRDLRPVAEHARAVSLVSVASRHSTYSLATTRSGQHPGSGSTLRGAPHRNNMNIILPQPLGPNSRPNSTYNVQHGEPPLMHLQHMGPQGDMPPHPPVQGLWNEYGVIRHRSTASRGEEWEGSNSGNTQMSPVTKPHRGMSHAQSAPTIDWRQHGSSLPGLPDHNVNVGMNPPPVPPLPPLFQMSRVDSRASGTSNQYTSAFLTPPTSLTQSQQSSPPRSPLSKIAGENPDPDIEVLTGPDPEKMEQIPQLEEPIEQARLLPDSVFADPNGELESATIESRWSSASFTPAQARLLSQQT